MKTQLITKHNQINKMTFNVNKYEKHGTIRNDTT